MNEKEFTLFRKEFNPSAINGTDLAFFSIHCDDYDEKLLSYFKSHKRHPEFYFQMALKNKLIKSFEYLCRHVIFEYSFFLETFNFLVNESSSYTDKRKKNTEELLVILFSQDIKLRAKKREKKKTH